MSSPGGKRGTMASRFCQRLKKRLLFSGDGVTPPNWPVIGLMFLSLFASAFTLSFLFPFLPEMILGFGYTEEQKGYYAGLVASSIFAGRAIGSYFWGWLSDTRGRKLVLLLTLGFSGVFSLIFGFTQTLTMAIIARFLTGLSSGILGTAKTVLYDVSDNTNQAVGMSMISLAWGAGIILGPACGGYLATPVQKYPDTFQDGGFFSRFPYIIPGALTCALNLIVLACIAWKLPETLNYGDTEKIISEMTPVLTVQSEPKDGCNKPNILNDPAASPTDHGDLSCHELNYRPDDGQRGNIDAASASQESEKSQQEQNEDQKQSSRSPPSVLPVSCPENSKESCPEKRKDKPSQDRRDSPSEHCSLKVLETDGNTKDRNCVQRIWNSLVQSSLVVNMRQSDVRKSVILFTIFSFAIIGFDDVFTVWASTHPRLDGLGFSTDKIGTVLSIVGIPLLLLFIFLFSTLVKYLGIKKTYITTSFLMCVAVSACPTLYMLSDRPHILWPLLLLILIPVRICASCCFSATALFINNSVTPDKAGAVNGIGMTFTAIARTLAPAMGGSIFAWSVSSGSSIGAPFDVCLTFFLFGMVFWATTIMCIFLPNRLNYQRKLAGDT